MIKHTESFECWLAKVATDMYDDARLLATELGGQIAETCYAQALFPVDAARIIYLEYWNESYY